MPKPGSVLTINDEPYEVIGQARLAWDEGDSEASIDLTGLRRQRDGRAYYFCNERLEPELFVELADYRAHEWAPVTPGREVTLTDGAFGALPTGDVLLTQLRAAEGPVAGAEDPPLQGVHKLLVLARSPTHPPTILAGRDLIPTSTADRITDAVAYVTDDTPAAALPRAEIPRRKVAHPAWRYFSYLLALGTAGLVLLDPEAQRHPTLDFVRLLWWLGLGSVAALIFLRRFPIRAAFHILAAGFLLHLHTLFVDHVIAAGGTPPAWNLEGYRIAGILVSLVLLDLLAPRWYGVLAHAALFSGSLVLLLYSIGFGIWALGSGEWAAYRQHFGGLPQGFLWIVSLVGFALHKARDYRRAPLTLASLTAQLARIDKGLEGALPDVLRRATTLGVLIDDVGDALHLSNDNRLTSASPLAPRFLLLGKLFTRLSRLPPELVYDVPLATQDLATLRSDLAAFCRALETADPSAPIPDVRPSPQLEAAARRLPR